MQGSLNAGAELDDELGIEEPQTEAPLDTVAVTPDAPPAEVGMVGSEIGAPNPTPELETLTALESQIDDFIYLMNDIQGAGGMNQTFALEAQRLVPEFGGVPIGYYTKGISATRYKLAMEELSSTLKSLILTAAGAIIAMITKFIFWAVTKWHDGKTDMSKATPEDAEKQAAAQAERMEEKAEVLMKLAHGWRGLSLEVPADKEAEALLQKPHNLNDLALRFFESNDRYDVALEFLTGKNPFFYDIVTHGHYSQAVAKTIKYLDMINSALMEKVKILEDIALQDRAHPDSVRHQVVNKSRLDVVAKPIMVQVDGRDKALTDLADFLAAARQDTQQSERHDKIVIDDVIDRLARAFKDRQYVIMYRAIGESLATFGKLRKKLDELNTTLGDLSTDGTPGHNSEGVAAELRQTISTVGRDVAGNTRLIAELETYVSYMDRMANEAIGISMETANQMAATYKRLGVDLPEGMQHFINAAKAAKKDK